MTALEFAERLDAYAPADKGYMLNEAAAMLRKQDAVIKQLREALVDIDNCYLNPKTRRRVIVGIAQAALAATEEFQK